VTSAANIAERERPRDSPLQPVPFRPCRLRISVGRATRTTGCEREDRAEAQADRHRPRWIGVWQRPPSPSTISAKLPDVEHPLTPREMASTCRLRAGSERWAARVSVHCGQRADRFPELLRNVPLAGGWEGPSEPPDNYPRRRADVSGKPVPCLGSGVEPSAASTLSDEGHLPRMFRKVVIDGTRCLGYRHTSHDINRRQSGLERRLRSMMVSSTERWLAPEPRVGGSLPSPRDFCGIWSPYLRLGRSGRWRTTIVWRAA
jgi:hypothetical protein